MAPRVIYTYHKDGSGGHGPPRKLAAIAAWKRAKASKSGPNHVRPAPLEGDVAGNQGMQGRQVTPHVPMAQHQYTEGEMHLLTMVHLTGDSDSDL